MERPEIQSQWEHENSRLQHFRGLMITINIVLLSLLKFIHIHDSSNIEIFIFLTFIILGISINFLWILFQKNIGNIVNSWGLQFFKELDSTDLQKFENINKIKIDIENNIINSKRFFGIRLVYNLITVSFGLIWITILMFSILS